MTLPLITDAPGITLPLAFSQETTASIPEIHVYVSACIKFLTSDLASSLLDCHPNDVAIHGPRSVWKSWWEWAAAGRARWKLLIPGWAPDLFDKTTDFPKELKLMLATIDQLTLPRTLSHNFMPQGHVPPRGMSPKKAHEVSQMTYFIQAALSQKQTRIRHIVDVGAGQGYLSRALSNFPLSMNVIALDFSEVQTNGAKRRGSNIQKKLAKMALKTGVDTGTSDVLEKYDTDTPSPSGDPPVLSVTTGSLTHEMISITPQTLQTSISCWISGQSASNATPVMFVALHACGTLTPDILRCFLANQISHGRCETQGWHAAALVVVGCCYNLMSPHSDFPMSELVLKELDIQEDKLSLLYNHRSLAAQSPLQWALNGSTRAAAELALRKVVYRALFGNLASSVSMHEHHVKIGRLRDSAYSSFEGFISEASKKTGIQAPLPLEGKPVELTNCLEVLHTLRSRIGPVVESLIIADRYLYLTENAHNSDVYVFNLFEQDLGSGRNTALVVLPHVDHNM